MGNNLRRQRVKRARAQTRASQAERDEAAWRERVATARDAPEPEPRRFTPWCPMPHATSFGAALYGASWRALPLWLKMLDYRERQAATAEVCAQYDARRRSRAESPADGARVV